MSASASPLSPPAEDTDAVSEAQAWCANEKISAASNRTGINAGDFGLDLFLVHPLYPRTDRVPSPVRKKSQSLIQRFKIIDRFDILRKLFGNFFPRPFHN